MKKLYTLLIAFLAINSAMAQGCLPEGITFTTQEQIDNFQTNYPGCTEIEGNLTIYGDNITSLNGLNSLVSVGSYLLITHSNQLVNLSGLNNLISVTGDLTISYNNALVNLSGLENLSSVANIDIYGNNLLSNLTGLDQITSLESYLTITDNLSLENLSGLNNLTRVNEGVIISQNPSLINLEGLNSLNFIGGFLIISWNESLININGLEEIDTIGFDFSLYNNNNLSSCSSIENLKTVGGGFYITDNYLTDFIGFTGLKTINGDFLIEENSLLINMSGLDSLLTIGGIVTIRENASLTGLSGIDNVDLNTSKNLSIYGNDLLSYCEVQSICDYITNPVVITDIHNNAPGCNSREEVEYACLVGIEDIIQENKLSIFPNPSSNCFTIQFSLEKEAQVRLLVMNNLGQEVAIVANETLSEGQHELNWNAEGMPAGVYFYSIQIGNQSGTGKMVLMK